MAGQVIWEQPPAKKAADKTCERCSAPATMQRKEYFGPGIPTEYRYFCEICSVHVRLDEYDDKVRRHQEAEVRARERAREMNKSSYDRRILRVPAAQAVTSGTLGSHSGKYVNWGKKVYQGRRK